MMEQFTINEKYAIVCILSQIMNADGIIHPKEEEYLNEVYAELGIRISDIEIITNIDILQAKMIISDITEEQRLFVRSLFVNMAKSDGYIHPKESAIISQLFK